MRGQNYHPIQTFNRSDRLNSPANRDQLQRESFCSNRNLPDLSGTGAFLINEHNAGHGELARMRLQAAFSINQTSPITKLLFNYDKKQVPP